MARPNVDAAGLVAVSIKDILDRTPAGGYLWHVRVAIRGESPLADACFSRDESLLIRAGDPLLERWQEHGSTILTLPTDFPFGCGSPEKWQKDLINRAATQASGFPESDPESLHEFDRGLANTILTLLYERFPSQMSLMEIKQQVVPEPSDDSIMAALIGLTRYGHIKGVIANGVASVNPLEMLTLTAAGWRHLSKAPEQPQMTVRSLTAFERCNNVVAMTANYITVFGAALGPIFGRRF